MLGDRLAFSRSYLNHDIWRYQIGGVPAAFIASSLHDVVPQFSPDGNRIAFASNRSGEMVEIWATDAEGLHPVQLAKGLGRGQGTPRWSPDGLLVTFDSLEEHGKSQIYVVDAKGGRPWRASPEASNGATPSFSRDGKWIYFFSNQTGRNEVWRVPFRGGAAQQITEQGGDTAFESTDGKTLFYTKSENSPLYAKPLDGGAERKVLDYVFRRSFVPFENGIYYIGRRDADNLNPIQFYEFSTGASRVIVKIEGPLHIGLSVSPDGKTFLFSKSVTSGADLMMIENFR
jgi:Tol biopolymer transport system component